MKKLVMMAALMVAMTAQAEEKIDTVVVDKAQKVLIITSDSTQEVKIVGQDGKASYEGKVPLNQYKMKKARKVKEEKYDPWDVDGDVGLGVNTPLKVSDGYGFATFRSWEVFLGLRFAYTPEKALQTYSFGLWLDWNTYGLSTNKMFAKDAQNVVGLTPYPQEVKNQSSRLSILSLSVPLLFTQKLGHKSPYKFTVGPVINFNVRGRLNTYYEQGDYEHSISIKDIDYRPVTISLMASFQYKDFGIYCKYMPMSVMKSKKNEVNENPEFQSLTFGLCL